MPDPACLRVIAVAHVGIARVGDAERIRATDVSRMLAVCVRKVQQMAARGELPGAAMVDGVWLFDPVQIRLWVKEQERLAVITATEWRKSQRGRDVARAANRLSATDEILARAQPWPESGCGIYFLIVEGRVMYVGRAVNVIARIAQHATVRKFDAWSWLVCPRRNLDATERAYINALLPEWNRDPVTLKMRSSTLVEGPSV